VAEGEVGAHHRVHRVQASDEHVADEVLGRDLGERPSELEDHEHVDARLLEQAGLALDGRQQPGLLPRRQDLARVAVERDGHRADVALAGGLDRAGDDGAVAEVQSVEEPDRDDGRPVGERQAVESPHDLHAPSLSDMPGRQGGTVCPCALGPVRPRGMKAC
jgi:hypothetical protein